MSTAIDNLTPAQIELKIKDAESALRVAKVTMMMQANTTFLTSMLFSLKHFVEMVSPIVGTIPTAATDGRNLWINPIFFMDQTPNARIGLLAHEVFHVALDHMHRRGNRNPLIWNMAGDYVINCFLTDAKYELPPGGLVDPKYRNMTTEQVYDLLCKKSKEEIEGLCGKAKWGTGDVMYPEDAPTPEQAVPKEEVTATILRATTQAKMMGQPPGSLPGEIEIELKKVINPELPWHVILQNFMTDFIKENYSFRRPNRRFLPDYYLPTTHSESLQHIAIAVDTSGSVTDHQFNVFITKIAEIQAAVRPKKITVIGFDTQIHTTQELTEDDNPFKKLKFKGRGGTQIKPVFEWAKEHKPALLITFTDGDFTKIEPLDRSIPLFWLIHDNPRWTYSIGRVVHYPIHRT